VSELKPGQQKVGRGPTAVTMERVTDDVWVMRGGFPAAVFNVYFIEEPGGGVTMWEAGIRDMAPHVEHVTRRMGGLNRIVLAHAHADHRGTAARLNAPVWCHEDEVEYAEADNPQPYFDYDKLPVARPAGRYVQKMLLAHAWDAGPVRIERRLKEGDTVAGFEVIHLPGHAPGLIGLWRERDRLALVSDCFYTFDAFSGGDWGAPRGPHAGFNWDHEKMRASIRRVATLGAETVWAGHADPVTGDVRGQLEHAADSA
jgi:hydroxyacylglutathione hydrolase